MDLSNKDYRKLFQEGCKGLKEKYIFDRKKQNYSNFVKLIERDLTSTRTMDVLESSTTWDNHAGTVEAKRIPEANGIVDIFKSNKATREEIIDHCDLVWSKEQFWNGYS